jgi:hypothetical protein
MLVLSFYLFTELREKDARIIPSWKALKTEKTQQYANVLTATRNNPALGMMAVIPISE